MNGDIWYIDTSTYIANLDVANITYQLPVNIDNMKIEKCHKESHTWKLWPMWL